MIGFVSSWNGCLDSMPLGSRDIYLREEYVRLYENGSERAMAFVYEDGDNRFVFPFLKREFSHECVTYCDFETAYGYGGPAYSNKDIGFLSDAYAAMREAAVKDNFVCGFARFHPLTENWDGFECIGTVCDNRKTVAVDLSQGINAAWRDELHSKNRNVIKKAIKAGLEFIVDENFDFLAEFESLYWESMERLGASEFYHFTDSYFRRIKEDVRGRFIGFARLNGRLVAGAIFLYDGQFGHYHLAGSASDSWGVSPNNFLLWKAIEELYVRGVRRFHLGGGSDSSQENTLFKFKARFSKSTCRFAVGKAVFNETIYGDLCRKWEAANPEKAVGLRQVLLKYKY